jgi:hypothetical protein
MNLMMKSFSKILSNKLMYEQDTPQENQIVLSKQTLDVLLKQKNAADLIALYSFYYYTAKWQNEQQTKATTGFVAKGLKWSEKKVRDRKKELIKLGLVSDVKQTDEEGKVTGWYIRVTYFWRRDPNEEKKDENHPDGFTRGGEKPQGGLNHSVDSGRTNALEAGKGNALEAGNKTAAPAADASPPQKAGKRADDNEPLDLTSFISSCRGSPKRYIRLIGEYADEKQLAYTTKGQWGMLIKRNVRAARRLEPYSDSQIAKAMQRIKRDLNENPGGFLRKWGLETIEKYLE